MIFNNFLTLSAAISLVAASSCADYEAMVTAFKNNDINGYSSGNFQGITYYAPSNYDGLWDLQAAKRGLIFNTYAMALMATTKAANAACVGAPLLGSYTNRYTVEGQAYGDIASSVQFVASDGFRGLDILVGGSNPLVEVWVHDNSLYLQSVVNSSVRVSIEPALIGYTSLHKQNNPPPDTWAAISSVSGWSGTAVDVESLASTLVQSFDSSVSGVQSDSGCYYTLNKQDNTQSASDQCQESSLVALLQGGGSTCPNDPSCVYTRDGAAQRSGSWQSTLTIGGGYTGVRLASCSSYKLQYSGWSQPTCSLI